MLDENLKDEQNYKLTLRKCFIILLIVFFNSYQNVFYIYFNSFFKKKIYIRNNKNIFFVILTIVIQTYLKIGNTMKRE